MSKGNRIVLTPDRAIKVEGFHTSGSTFYPGMVVQIDPTVTAQGNKFAWKLYDADADGGRPKGPLIVLTEDILQGKTTADAYDTTSGTRLFGVIPLPGCELNLLLINIAGTADDHAIGEIIIPDDTTGKWVATTGSPEIEPAMILETVTDPTADTLVHAIWTGY